MIFKRKSKPSEAYWQLKLYVTPGPRGLREACLSVLESFLKLVPTKLSVYSINYGKEVRFSLETYRSAITKISDEDVEHVDAYIEHGAMGMAFSRAFAYLKLPTPCFELRLSVKRNHEVPPFLELTRVVASQFTVLYGYGRILTENIEPASELVIHKSLFGSSNSGNPMGNWLVNPLEIGDGGIKGFYPFNVWNRRAQAHGYLSTLQEHLALTAESIDGDISVIRLSHEALKKLGVNYPKHVHEDTD